MSPEQWKTLSKYLEVASAEYELLRKISTPNSRDDRTRLLIDLSETLDAEAIARDNMGLARVRDAVTRLYPEQKLTQSSLISGIKNVEQKNSEEPLVLKGFSERISIDYFGDEAQLRKIPDTY